jgi:alkylation response protein AidB-like acyl-CoA dehydrogenase
MSAELLVSSLLPQPRTDHLAARDLARQYAPSASVEDDGAEFREAWKRFADFGVYCLTIPRTGLDVDSVLGMLEGLGEGTRNAGFLLSIGAHSFAAGAAISRFASEGQREVLDLMRDGSVIAAFAATEPEAGSDVMSLRTRCAAVDDDYVIDGTKHFITNAWLADYFVVFATKDRRLNWRGITAYLVPRDTPGLSIGPPQRLIGLTGCSMCAVHLDSVRVPRSAILGRLGQGSSVFRHAMLWERSLLAAVALGAMRRQLTDLIGTATTRDQQAETSAGNSDIVRLVVDIASRYVVGRLLVRDTVTKLAADTLTPAQASLAKLWISEAELATSHDLTGADITTELVSDSPRMSDLFNAIGATIYSGTSDIQRKIIAAELGIFQ